MKTLSLRFTGSVQLLRMKTYPGVFTASVIPVQRNIRSYMFIPKMLGQVVSVCTENSSSQNVLMIVFDLVVKVYVLDTVCQNLHVL